MIEIIIVVMFSLSLGSFGNNVITHFISDCKLDILRSVSQCCNRKLSIMELLPVVSYIVQKGRCKGCVEPISRRYLFVEIMSVALGILIFLMYDFSPNFFFLYLISFLLLLISVIDYYKLIIPNKLLIALFSIIIIFLIYSSELNISLFLTSLVVLAGLYFVGNIVSRIKKTESLGMGDMKLVFILSLPLNIYQSVAAIWLASLLALIVLLTTSIGQIKNLSSVKVPFGIYLSIGFMIIVFITRHSEFNSFTNFVALLWN